MLHCFASMTFLLNSELWYWQLILLPIRQTLRCFWKFGFYWYMKSCRSASHKIEINGQPFSSLSGRFLKKLYVLQRLTEWICQLVISNKGSKMLQRLTALVCQLVSLLQTILKKIFVPKNGHTFFYIVNFHVASA